MNLSHVLANTYWQKRIASAGLLRNNVSYHREMAAVFNLCLAIIKPSQQQYSS